MTALEFIGASVALGGRMILSDVNLTIDRGEFIGLLGPNGAGKTTLLRAALGLVPLRAGEVRAFGEPARRGAKSIGYMPQTRGAYDLRWTGWDFVAAAAGGGRWGLPTLSRAERSEVDRVIDLVGAAALARRPLADMSGGERQRLLLSQALLGAPSLLLLDEPLISLDPAHQRAVVDLAGALRDELNLTVLFSAHELNPLLGAIDRVLYVGGGAAVLGSVDDVIQGPVLSKLYGAQIDVLRVGSHIFVVDGRCSVESEAHRHDDHGHEHHDHAHEHGHGREKAGDVRL